MAVYYMSLLCLIGIPLTKATLLTKTNTNTQKIFTYVKNSTS